ncbi:MAG: ATP-binding protein [Candidatus Hodarchaeota archaeon]
MPKRTDSSSNEVGTLICTFDGPSATEFSFVVTNNALSAPVRTGQFICTKSEDGMLVGMVTEVIKSNRYFNKAESVREYERGGHPLSTIFPADRWEFALAKARPMGVFVNGNIDRVSFPPSPGEKVYLAEKDILARFLGLDLESGLDIGNVRYHGIPARLNITKLLQKHVAVLAMSGGGKSYLSSVLVEELLSRKENQGRIASIIIDVHGEYTAFADGDFSDRVNVMKSAYVQIATPLLSASMYGVFQPQTSPIQLRELSRILSNVYKENKPFSISDVARAVEADDRINVRTRDALLGWLYGLENTGLFGYEENPDLKNVIEPGKCLILDLSETTSLRKKQIIVAYLLWRLFSLRKIGEIAPFAIFLEEAHQFCPEARIGSAISKNIIETVAREGRKFHSSLCLISQRPVRLSTTVLSQCNTHIILRVTNPYDLDHIRASSEQITRESLNMISTLPVGEALIVGAAVNYPIFVKIRKRKSKEPAHSLTLEEAAKRFEGKL